MSNIYLDDEFFRVWEKIENNENFALLRYGDGERAVMTGRSVKAQEGWVSPDFVSELGSALLNTLNVEDENFIYHINDDDTLEIIRLKNNLDEVVIPSVINGKSVTSIGNWSFSWYYISNLENVIIPESIVSIGEGAFDGCDKLLSVTFENSNGWQVSSDGTSDWTSVNEDLSNSTTAKDCLVNTYRTYYWKRV